MNLTSEDYIDGIRTLLIEVLGIQWARQHLPGALLDIPEHALPALYARAQADAEAIVAEAEAREAAERDAPALATMAALDLAEAEAINSDDGWLYR